MKTVAKLSLAVGLLLVAWSAHGWSGANAGSELPTLEVAVDVDTSGNADNTLGPTESCNETPIEVGDTIEIDVVVRGVPPHIPGPAGGSQAITGAGFNLLFDPDVLQVDLVQEFNGPTILKAEGEPIPIAFLDYKFSFGEDLRDGPPGDTGNVRLDMADLSTNYDDGSGVLSRITVTAIGDGRSRLDLVDLFDIVFAPGITVLDAASLDYGTDIADATIGVGISGCTIPTPTPIPTPSPPPPFTGTPEPRPEAPIDTLDLGIDAEPSGNSDNALGTVQTCRRVDQGDTFVVDIVVKGIPPYQRGPAIANGITGFAMDLLFDPDLLRVDLVQAWAGPSILKAGGFYIPFGSVYYDGQLDTHPPGTTGDVRMELSDFSTTYEDGEGILTRVSVSAVGQGVATLELADVQHPGSPPAVFDGHVEMYPVAVSAAHVVIGDAECPSPTPTPRETASPTPSASPTPTPTPHVTPAQLPRGGGQVSAGNGSVAFLTLGAVLTLGGAFVLARRRA